MRVNKVVPEEMKINNCILPWMLKGENAYGKFVQVREQKINKDATLYITNYQVCEYYKVNHLFRLR